MKKLVSILVLALGVSALQGEERGKPDPSRITAAVRCGNAAIEVDDYGDATAFTIGEDNHLSPIDGSRQWISINNSAVLEVSNTNYTVTAPVTVDDSGCPTDTRAFSTVVSNKGDLQIDYTHTVSDYGDGLASWFVQAALTNRTADEMRVCYYHYAHINLYGNPDNNSSTYTGSDPDTGLPAFRPIRDADFPDQVFVYRTYVPRDAWAQLLYPQLSDLIASFGGCSDLPRIERMLSGDITGAFEFNRVIPPGASVSVRLEIGRVQ